jgi:signal transduction histidine kinase
MTDAGTKILIVDDDDAGRYLKAHIFRKIGFAVSEAATGHAAIDHCAADTPDILLLDVKLPDISGIEVCRRLKASYPGIAVLQTSAAFHSARDRTLAFEGGADSLLIEPIEPEELIASVRALLRGRRAEQDLRRLNETLEVKVAERTRELEDTNRRLEHEIAERRKAEEVLWHSQKMDVLGQLTGGVAHDFNNILAVIVGSLELAHAGLEGRRQLPPEKIRQLIAAAQTAAQRGGQVTQQLLAFARKSILTSETLALNEVIAQCEGFLRRALGETINLNLEFAPDLWPCTIDPVQFEAALLNLVVNARDAMPKGGRLDIKTANVLVEDGLDHDADAAPPGPYVRVRVSDTGTGMEPEVMARAFEPFFTTKDLGKGSGLGLSQVYGFVKQTGGHVSIDSTVRSGTTFNLYLPASEEVAKSRLVRSGVPTKETPTGTETILVVEDNEDVRDVVVAVIEDLGYRIVVAPNGQSALAHIRNDRSIDLVFTDLVMPGGLSGFDLIREAKSLRGELKFLVTSGYAGAQADEAGSGKLPLILKPYHRTELATKIRLALNGR